MHLKLVAHVGCPFAHRVRTVLREKSVAFELVVIEITDKSPWFLALSPRGRAPMLLVDGAPLFDSGAICELLEELVPTPAMFPADPVARARDRNWCAVVNDDLNKWIFMILAAKTPDERAKHAADLNASLARFDETMRDRAYLSGDGERFGMPDVFAAPFFVRTHVLTTLQLWSMPAGLSNVVAWRDRLCARPSVVQSTTPDMAAFFVRRFGLQAV